MRDEDGKEDTGSDRKTPVSQSRKRAACRVLDSDDENEEEDNMEITKEIDSSTKHSEAAGCKAESLSEQLCLSSNYSDSTMHSTSLFGDATRDGSEMAANLARQRNNLKKKIELGQAGRRPSVMADLEEASMPPLMLNDSIDSSSDSDGSFDDNFQKDNETTKADSATTATTAVEQDKPSTQPVVDEEEGARGDPENSSLELSLLWQPSMPPPAQVRKDSSDELLPLGAKVCRYRQR